MKPQFDHKVLSSFYLWFDDRLTRYGEAVQTRINQQFYYSNLNIDIPTNQVAYYSPDRQLVANGETVPSGVYISGGSFGSSYSWVDQNGNDNTGLLIDFDKGRVIMKEGVGESLAISGDFDRKTINCYITNETEEELLFNTDFLLSADDDDTFLQSVTGLGAPNYTVPAVFLSYNSSVNTPFAFGGMQDTKSNIRALVIVNDNFSLDGALSLFRDSTETCVPIIEFSDFPFGEYFHIKSPPYTYSGLYATKMEKNAPYAFIEKVTSSKMYDTAGGATTIPQNMRIGFIDFTLSTPRLPKVELATPSWTNTYSLLFDGVDDHLSLASSITLAGAKAVSVWVKAGANIAAGAGSKIVAGATDAFPQLGYGRFIYTVGTSNGGTPATVQYIDCGVNFFTEGSWYHICISSDGTTSTYYVNGVVKGTSPNVNPQSLSTIGGVTPFYHDSNIDELALFDYDLSIAQISNIYNGGTPVQLGADGLNLSPLGYWRMGDNNAGFGTTVSDEGTGSNNATLVNGPVFSLIVP